MKINVGDFGYKVPDGTTGAQAGAASFVQPGLKELGAAGMKVGAELAQGDQLDAQIKYRERTSAASRPRPWRRKQSAPRP
jgi:hypothetical protein